MNTLVAHCCKQPPYNLAYNTELDTKQLRCVVFFLVLIFLGDKVFFSEVKEKIIQGLSL